MTEIVVWILTALDIIVAILLILLILAQQSKEGGFGGSAFGGMGESVFGVQAASHLSRLTVILASAFLIITLSLTVITGHRKTQKTGLMDNNPELFAPGDEEKKDQAAKAAPAQAKAGAEEEESTETLPDGTIIKKVKGGTIKMTPVKKEEVKPPAQPGDAGNAEESTETLPDGTIIKKVKGGTIKMTPVKGPVPESKPVEKKPESGNPPAPSGEKAQNPPQAEEKPAEGKK